MDIGERRQANILVLAPVGRIDNLTSADFQARLLAAVSSSSADVVVDFSGVEYISSAGLRALMAATRLKPKERRLAVACLIRSCARSSRSAGSRMSYRSLRPSRRRALPGKPRRGPKGAWSPMPKPNRLAPLRVRFLGHPWLAAGTAAGAGGPRQDPRRAARRSRACARDAEQAIDAFIDSALPFSVRGTFGGNTSCVEIITGGDEYVICDLGTGVREFGNRVLRQHGPDRKHTFNIFLSHPHWDHIMGFPFFAPAYIPGNRICIYGCHAVLREALRTQHSAPWFPVDFRSLGFEHRVYHLGAGHIYEVAGLSVTSIKQFHTGDSYGYRFSQGGKSIVYSTDCEHKCSHSTKHTHSSRSTETPTC